MNKVKILLVVLNIVSLSFIGCTQQKNQKFIKMDSSNKEKLNLTDEEWKQKLSDEQYYILRAKGTEKPFSGKFVFTKDKGTYKCAGCGAALFTDDMKFDSHCGWPSFDKEIAGGRIIQTEDNSLGMQRVEITCAKCGGHLGHLFNDGPTKTGLRYCVNSGSLSFEPSQEKIKLTDDSTEVITLAGGCFWCIEAIFEDVKGVKKVVSGYANGNSSKPTYKQVCTGNTGFAEAVEISFNPKFISIENLLEIFFTLHDPTTLNRQGADVGTQYRSGVYYHNNTQKEIAEKVIKTLNQNKVFEKPIVTEVKAINNFYEAEDYHQEYYELNQEQPYCKMVILPKVEKLHKIFKEKLKN